LAGEPDGVAVGGEGERGNDQQGSRAQEHNQKRREREANCDALQDARQAQVRKIKLGEGVEEEAQNEDDGCAAGEFEPECACGLTVARAGGGASERAHREPHGDADDKEEERKDQIGGGAAVPRGVAEWGVDMRPTAGVVDEDHESHGEPAQGIDAGAARGLGWCDGLHRWRRRKLRHGG